MEIREVKLGEVATVKGGKRLPKGINLITKPNSHPYIRVRDLNGKRTLELDGSFEFVDDETQKAISRYIVTNGDIVLSIVGTIGLVSIVGGSLNEANLTENCVKLTSFSGIDRDYLYYYLRSSYGQQEIARGTVGAVQAKLPIKNILNITIPLPDEDTQRKIAAILSSLDTKIETNQMINDNLEEQVKCIFNNEYAPNLYRKGWTVGTIGDVVTLQRGYDLPKDKMTLGIYPVAGSTDTIFYHNNYTTDAPCIVIGRSGNIGKPRLYMEKCWAHNTTLFVKDFKGNNPYWVYYMLCSIDYSQFQGGSAVPTLNRNYVHAFEIAIPPANQQNEFAEKILPFLLQIKSNQAEIYTLSKIRDALLPRLMSGEIDVSAVQL